MASWRDGVSQAVQDDIDELFAAVLPFAEQTLGKYGEMLPFGASLGADGTISMLASDPELGEQPPSQNVLEALYEGARAGAGSCRAVAFVADVRVDGGDAIRAELEHRDGVAMALIVPYTRSRLRKRIALGRLSGTTAAPRIWAS